MKKIFGLLFIVVLTSACSSLLHVKAENTKGMSKDKLSILIMSDYPADWDDKYGIGYCGGGGITAVTGMQFYTGDTASVVLKPGTYDTEYSLESADFIYKFSAKITTKANHVYLVSCDGVKSLRIIDMPFKYTDIYVKGNGFDVPVIDFVANKKK